LRIISIYIEKSLKKIIKKSRCLSPTFQSRTQADTLRSLWKLLSQLELMQPTIRLPLPRVVPECSPGLRPWPPSAATIWWPGAQPRHSLQLHPHSRSSEIREWRQLEKKHGRQSHMSCSTGVDFIKNLITRILWTLHILFSMPLAFV